MYCTKIKLLDAIILNNMRATYILPSAILIRLKINVKHPKNEIYKAIQAEYFA